MTSLKPSLLLIALVMLVFTSCASLNEAREERFNRHYLGEVGAVSDAAELAFLESGITIENKGWSEDESKYEILGYIQIPAASARSLVGSQEGMINIAKVVMTIEKAGDGVVFTHIDTSTNRTHAMASSADKENVAGEPEEDIYNILDKKFDRLTKEETEES